jgi:hypothetical protein
MEPKLYVKKPIPVKMIQWTGNNLTDVKSFLGDDYKGTDENDNVLLKTMESDNQHQQAKIGDYIVRGVQGEHYPIDESVMLSTYDLYKKPFAKKVADFFVSLFQEPGDHDLE